MGELTQKLSRRGEKSTQAKVAPLRYESRRWRPQMASLAPQVGGQVGLGGGRAATGGDDMIEGKERKPYWLHTKWQMLASLVPFLVVIIVLPLYADELNSSRFLGFPLGFFLAA